MVQWEHTCVIKSVKNFESLAGVLDDYGKNGWETIYCERENSFRNDYNIVLKRKVLTTPVDIIYVDG